VRDLPGLLYLLLPLLGGAIASGLCIRFGWLRALARPIDGGRTLGGRPIFGPNKTLRGVLAVVIGNTLVLGLQSTALHYAPAIRRVELFDYGMVNGWLVGLAVGTLAALAELPNSFLKRRLNIPAGQSGPGAMGALFYFVDQVDILVGVWLAYSLVVDVTLWRVVLSVGLIFVLHQAVTLIGGGLGMRPTPT
jgi:hypothetical protein